MQILLQKARTSALALGVIAAGSVMASQAHAVAILSFGQVGNENPIIGTQSGTTTTITTTNTLISISQIDSAITMPTTAYLIVDFTSTDAAMMIAGNIEQNYSGNFSITSGPSDSGTNYLSGTLVDVAFGANSAFTLSASTPPSGSVTFTSSVIGALSDPLAASFSFANVTPTLTIVDGTISSFSSSVSGTFSATPATAVPEPASLALLGAGLCGLGVIRRRKQG